MERIVLATWNISECVSANWDVSRGIDSNPTASEINANCDEIISLINKYDIDIICFQEYPVKTETTNVTARITRETSLKHYYAVDTYPTFLVKDGRAGIAVFSKTELGTKKFAFMQNPGITKLSKTGKLYYSFDKGVITTDIAPCEKTLIIVTGHAISFSPFDAVAEDYPESFYEIETSAFATAPDKNNVVVLGDFNTENLFSILPNLAKTFKDNLDGPTTAPGVMEGEDFKDGRKLDYFLTSPSVTVTSCQKIRNFSDHCLCICECSF